MEALTSLVKVTGKFLGPHYHALQQRQPQHTSASASTSSSSSPWQTRLQAASSKTLTPRATVASNALAQTFTFARTSFESLTSILPPRIQALLPRPEPSPSSSSFLFDKSNTSLSILVGSLVVPLLLVVISMSGGWRSYLSPGRYSPFTTAPPSRPTVTEDDYHYLGPEDIVDPPRHDPYSHNNFPRHGLRADAEDPRAPDILILKHRGTTYPLHFPAFTIGEGILKVGELRRFAAQQTGAGNPNRVKLLYKGKILKDDAVACREEGLKQNSELMCVVSDAVGGKSEDETSEDSASEDEMAYEDRMRGGDGPRVDVDGTIIGGSPRRRRHRTKKVRHQDEEPTSHPLQKTMSSASATAAHPPRPATTAPPPRQASTPQPPRPASSQPPPQPSNLPKTAMQKLDEIIAVFRDQFEPLAEGFLANPPHDEKTRKQEYMKLSESILAQVIFKLDGVETEGDTDARAKRKALVQETQAMLNRLDAVGKEPVDEPVGKGKKGRRNR